MKKQRKRISLKKLKPKERMSNAKKWLGNYHIKNLVHSYAKRYKVDSQIAYYELIEIGFKDEIAIEQYESKGIEWEYKVDGYTGDMLVVPKGTPEWKLHNY